MKLYSAAREAGLSVTLHTRRALVYEGPAARDAPHVRAASGVCWVDDCLCVVQDDALYAARITPDPFRLESVALPLRSDGARFFDKARGNKADKPDLEACVSVRRQGATFFFGIGSGSTSRRTSLLCGRVNEGAWHTTWFDASGLYTAIAAQPGFLSSELNLEGAADMGTHVRLFQRSNGVAFSGLTPRCASCDISWDAFFRYVYGAGAVPAIENVQQYALGALDGVPLSVTCAITSSLGAIYLLASAEASPNAVDDGLVTGSVLGVVRGEHIVWGALRDAEGLLVREKAEGIAEKPGDPGSFYVVFDPDDHQLPATLAELSVRALP